MRFDGTSTTKKTTMYVCIYIYIYIGREKEI